MKTAPFRTLGITLLLASLLPALFAQEGPGDEATRRIEEELAEPFCYFLVPSDVLGFKDCPEGTQVTHDGAFNTAFGEFDLFAGSPPRPVSKRVKTLLDGYLPVIEYAFRRDGAAYEVQAFAAPIDLDPRGNLVNFVRVSVRNDGPEKVRAGIGAAFLDRHGEGRHPLGCVSWYRDRFMDEASFGKGRRVSLDGGAAWQDDHLIFLYEPEGATIAEDAKRDEGSGPWVTYDLDLAAGEGRSVDFVFPYVPIQRERTAEIDPVRAADPEELLARVVAFWESVLGSAMSIDLPEAKVVQTAKASLVYDLIARDVTEDGKGFIQKVNEFQYDSFYPRDSAYIIRTYDLLGLHEIAEETLEPFIVRDEEGRPEKLRRMMPDDWGQSLWSVAAHFRATGDREYAEAVFPVLSPHVADFVEACAKDPLGLWPAAPPYDNEAITGHYTGHSFWALLGLREAIHLAEAIGRPTEAKFFRGVRDDYRKRFLSKLGEVAARADGYIPPGLDDPLAGYDWANASAGVYPFGVLEPDDPLVTATVEMVREHKYREGIMTYGPNAFATREKLRAGRAADPGWLHHYETFYVVQTLLARGEQRKVLEDFYSILAHTGSTHSGFEFSIRPWSNRDPGGNRPPHGWFAARYNALLRNMLLREEGETLHIASAVSPAWLHPGSRIAVRDGATRFGPITFSIDAGESGAEVVLSPRWRRPPSELRFHLPWFLEVTEARIDGTEAEPRDGALEIPPSAGRVSLKWRWRETPDLGYETAVRLLLEKYHRRPEDADYDFLFPTPRPPVIAPRQGIFIDSIELELRSPGGRGTIHCTTDGSPVDRSSPLYEGPLRLEETTTVRALSAWEDGRESAPMEVTVRRVSPQAAIPAPGEEPGYRYRYYEGAWKMLPDFDSLTPVREGRAPAFDLDAVDHRGDDFGVVFDGIIEAPADGVYQFALGSDDGSRLLIGETLVVDNDGLHPMKEEQGSIALAKGAHAIRVEFFERGGAERLSVEWGQAPIRKSFDFGKH